MLQIPDFRICSLLQIKQLQQQLDLLLVLDGPVLVGVSLVPPQSVDVLEVLNGSPVLVEGSLLLHIADVVLVLGQRFHLRAINEDTSRVSQPREEVSPGSDVVEESRFARARGSHDGRQGVLGNHARNSLQDHFFSLELGQKGNDVLESKLNFYVLLVGTKFEELLFKHYIRLWD